MVLFFFFCNNRFSHFNFIKSEHPAWLWLWSNRLILFLWVCLLLIRDQGFPFWPYVWPDSNTTFLVRSELIYPFSQPFKHQAHLILTLALNPIGHRRFDVNVCVGGLVATPFPFVNLLQRCLETPQCFTEVSHQTGGNKGMKRCGSHEWRTTAHD